MIVRTLDDGSMILINQTDHAKLSGLFAAHWGNGDFAAPTPHESMLRAATFHDHGWLRYETAPHYDAIEHTSPSFYQSPPTEDQLAAFGWAIDWLTDIDRYAGLMIGRHRTGLYRGRYGAVQKPVSVSRAGQNELIDAFVRRYEAKQEIELAQLDRRRVMINYQLLQFWDLLSLSLCLRDPRNELFEFVPTSYDGDGANGIAMRMDVSGDGAIRLDPYPFDRRPLEVGFVYRHLPTATFADEAAFRQAYFGAVPMLREFKFI